MIKSFTFKRDRDYVSYIDRVLISCEIISRVILITHKAEIDSDHLHDLVVFFKKCIRVKKSSET